VSYYSFVLVCYNNWNLSKQAITTLINSLDDKYKTKGIELIIVNNGSTDETGVSIEDLKRLYTAGTIEIIEIRLEENMGYAVGLNIGLARTTGRIITIMNNDLIFTKDWFNGLAEILENNYGVGVAAPYLSYAATIQNLGVLFSSIDEIDNFAKKFMQNNKEKVSYVDNVISACVSFRRDMLMLIGGFDFWFGMGMADDTDWSFRANITGLRIAVVGSSFVYHIGNATFAKIPEITSAAIISNHPKFMIKWNLKGKENENGLHHSFREVIQNNTYLREKNYFPTKISEFNLLSEPLLEKKDNSLRILLAADWTNIKSQWRTSLQKAISFGKSDKEICLWIPQQYFMENEVGAEVKKIVGPLDWAAIKLLYNNISPVDLLRFLRSFDVIVSVEDDYVNRYIISLAKELNLPVR